ncbi:hypothetical protein HDU96_007682 [Phlyctochytrium bullatum]|nr:hypothetical protein HDU96_007682 [Phlyctochytrium bullatum]
MSDPQPIPSDPTVIPTPIPNQPEASLPSSTPPATTAPSSAQPQAKCKFFNTPKGCRSGDTCRFLHVAKPTPPSSSEPVRTEQANGKRQKKPSKPNLKAAKETEESGPVAGTPTQAPTVKKLSLQMINGKMVAVEVTEPVAKPAATASGEAAGGEKKQKGSAKKNRGAAASANQSTPATNGAANGKAPEKVATPPSERPINPARAPVARPTPGSVSKPAKPPSPASTAATTTSIAPLHSDRATTEVHSLERRFRLDASNKPNFRELSRAATTVTFRFRLTPSDPDFPFDLDFLEVDLTLVNSDDLPSSHPPISGSKLLVRNGNIPAHLARSVERAWDRTTAAICSTNPTGPGSSLLAMANWLDRNLERLLSATETVGSITFVSNVGGTDAGAAAAAAAKTSAAVDARTAPMPVVGTNVLVARDAAADDRDGFKGKVFYYGVPRDASDPGSESEEDDESDASAASDFCDDDETTEASRPEPEDGEGDEEAEVEDEEEDDPASQPSSFLLNTAHRGIQIRLPDATLSTVSLMSCVSLSLQVRCLRCKADQDVLALPAVAIPPSGDAGAAPATASKPRVMACATCSHPISVGFRPTPMHKDSHDMGYLDVEGCKPVDLLPSAWEAMCGGCGKSNGPTGMFKSMPRGVESVGSCAGCFKKLKATINLVKFIQLTGGAVKAPEAAMPMRKKKKKEDEGIVLGQPLPKNGACEHYRKSYRWFRFPCCGKVYPCDLCHEDRKSDTHDMAWATRMVCGFCSREQPYSQKPCACGKELTRKSGGGFWEGGQGTRERRLMSRKEGRKYKGTNKTVSMKSARAGAAAKRAP